MNSWRSSHVRKPNKLAEVCADRRDYFRINLGQLGCLRSSFVIQFAGISRTSRLSSTTAILMMPRTMHHARAVVVSIAFQPSKPVPVATREKTTASLPSLRWVLSPHTHRCEAAGGHGSETACYKQEHCRTSKSGISTHLVGERSESTGSPLVTPNIWLGGKVGGQPDGKGGYTRPGAATRHGHA